MWSTADHETLLEGSPSFLSTSTSSLLLYVVHRKAVIFSEFNQADSFLSTPRFRENSSDLTGIVCSLVSTDSLSA